MPQTRCPNGIATRTPDKPRAGQRSRSSECPERSGEEETQSRRTAFAGGTILQRAVMRVY